MIGVTKASRLDYIHLFWKLSVAAEAPFLAGVPVRYNEHPTSPPTQYLK